MAIVGVSDKTRQYLTTVRDDTGAEVMILIARGVNDPQTGRAGGQVRNDPF